MKYFMFFCIFLCACSSQTIIYSISDRYSGPCIIKIDDALNEQSRTVEVDSGLGTTNFTTGRSDFLFKSKESGGVYEVIEIGSLQNAQPGKRYIFELLIGNSTIPDCISSIKAVTFFIGTKEQFELYSVKFHSPFEYFITQGTDLCN